VLVTATRRVISNEEVSSGLTLVDSERVQSQKLVTDALASNVGVFLQQTTPGQGAAIIRGLKGSSILHLVDGMRLNNAIFRSAPTQYFSLVPITAVERIEVLRGTPTSLYGNDAVGGVVQLVTRVPKFDTPDTQSRGEIFASFDTAELGKTARATVDIGNRTLASSFSAEYLTTGNRRTGSGTRIGPSGYESKATRLIMVHGKYTRKSGPAGLDWNTDVAWQRVDDDRVTRDLGADSRRRESNSSDLFGVTISGSRISDAGSWIVGVEYYDDRVDSQRLEENVLTGVSRAVPSRFPDGSRVRQAALFGNVQRRITARHELSAGIRISNDDISLPSTGLSVAATINETDVGGDLGWIFDASKRWQLLANVGLGFRAPNVFDLGTLGDRPGNRFNIPNTALKSERVLQGDVGVRYRSDRVKFDFMIYALRYDDRITSVGTGEVTTGGRDVVQSVNAAESSIHGAEAGIDIRISESIGVRAVLNYTWGEQQISGDDEEPAGRIPPLNGNVTLTYDKAGDYRLMSWLRFAAEQDRLSARDIGDVRIDPEGTPGWVSVGASIQKEYARNWRLSLSLDNLLDKRYRVHGSGLDAPGRNLTLSVRRNW
jgi:outer membrane receptor protein involved in Fe transport